MLETEEGTELPEMLVDWFWLGPPLGRRLAIPSGELEDGGVLGTLLAPGLNDTVGCTL